MSLPPNDSTAGPLVSIGMPFLNAEKYIREAIESVLAQSYPAWELLLVDDGSTDSSSSIACEYACQHPARIRYLRHGDRGNHGISASRNLAIRNAAGEYIGFLDADDVWMPGKLRRQVDILEAHPQASMVYGQTQYWYSWTGDPQDRKRDFIPDHGVPAEKVFHPPELLLTLYPLGCATAPSISNVLSRRELMEKTGGFEDEFRGMYEDQAFLVKAYLNGSVFVSSECWDRYRIHPNSCLSVATSAGQYEAVRRKFLHWFEGHLRAQEIADPQIWKALELAVEARTPKEDVYYDGWFFRVADNDARLVVAPEEPGTLRIEVDKCSTEKAWDIQLNHPRLNVQAGHRYQFRFEARADQPRSVCAGVALAHEPWSNIGLYRSVDLTPEWRSFQEDFVSAVDDENVRIHFDLGGSEVPVEVRSAALCLPDGTPAPGGIQFGTFRRLTPLSRSWGYDRGQPIDRYYIENYLLRHAADVRGRVMEIEDNTYTYKFGGTRVTRSDVLHVFEGNPRATLVGDLTDAPQIPSNIFDCIVLTQTLQLIYDFKAAIRTLHRILRPGGVLLVTFPGISQTNDRDWSNDWYWSFTPLCARRMFQDEFGAGNVEIETFGSVLSAISFLHGLSAGELTHEELAYTEPGYEVTIGVRATKAEGAE